MGKDKMNCKFCVTGDTDCERCPCFPQLREANDSLREAFLEALLGEKPESEEELTRLLEELLKKEGLAPI